MLGEKLLLGRDWARAGAGEETLGGGAGILGWPGAEGEELPVQATKLG